jgi:CheY-like chemotaxis protein/Tfp pilus assembly protein PilZ
VVKKNLNFQYVKKIAPLVIFGINIANVGMCLFPFFDKGGVMSKHILIVDSSQSFTKYVEVVLMRLEYSSMTARSARDGLQILKGRVPDLIITEAVLPEMNGLEFCRRIKSRPRTRRIPVLVVTVDSRFNERIEHGEDLFNEFLTKPVSVRDLYDALQRQLPYHSGRKKLRAPIAARVICKDGTHYRSYITLSVGEGGMFVETDQPREKDETIEPQLLLPGLVDPLPLKGKVVYSVKEEREKHPQGMGIKFFDMDEETKNILSNYVESYLMDGLPKGEQTAEKTG